MNKLLLFLALFSLNAFARPSSTDFEATLKFTTNLKYVEKHTLARRNKMIVKDGLILPSEKILISKNNISYLINSDPKSEPSLKCVEGTYEFLVKKGGKTKNEKGCTNSKRFGELIAVFKSI